MRSTISILIAQSREKILRRILVVILLGFFLLTFKINATAQDTSATNEPNTGVDEGSAVSQETQGNNAAKNASAAEETGSGNTAATTESIFGLDEIVVTASRLDQSVEDSPNRVTVVGSEALETFSSKTVDEVLEEVPGVNVLRAYGFTDSTSTVTMRGFGGQTLGRTLVLIDGIPFNSVYDGEVYWNAIPKDNVERIEVVPGTSSALYGGGAMGGVINIITKEPEKLESEIDTSFGSYITRSINISNQDRLGNFGYLVSAGFFDTNGYYASADSNQARTNENYNANVKLFYDVDKDISLGLSFRDYNEKVNGGYTVYYGYKHLNHLGFNFKKIINNNIDVLGTVYGNFDTLTWNYPSSESGNGIPYQDINPQTIAGGNLQTNIHFFESNTLSLGTDFRWGEANDHDEYQNSPSYRATYSGKEDSLGVYLQDMQKFFDGKFIVTLGGRWDYWRSYAGYYNDPSLPQQDEYNPKTSNAFSPKIGLVYHLTPDTTLRVSAGESFRPPTLYDLYTTWSYWGYTWHPNPNLGPEKAWSYEAGFDQTLWHKLLVRFTFYYSDVSDLIYSINSVSDPFDFYAQNVAKAVIYGVEPELRYSLTKEISFFGNFTVDSSKIVGYSYPALEGKWLTSTPRIKSSFGCSYKNPKYVDIDIVGRYVGDEYWDDANQTKVAQHTTFDIALSRKITNHVEAVLNIDNIFDKKYIETPDPVAPGYFAPGITIMGTLKITF
jgi:iron complex outermembrane receptor protein